MKNIFHIQDLSITFISYFRQALRALLFIPAYFSSVLSGLKFIMNRMRETCQILLMSNYDASLHFSDSQFFRFSDSTSPSHVRMPPSKWMTSNPALESFSAASIL